MRPVLLLRRVSLLDERIDAFLFRGQAEPLEVGVCRFFGGHEGQRVLIFQQIDNLLEGFVGLVALAFDHVPAGGGADVLEVGLTILMRLLGWVLAAAPLAAATSWIAASAAGIAAVRIRAAGHLAAMPVVLVGIALHFFFALVVDGEDGGVRILRGFNGVGHGFFAVVIDAIAHEDEDVLAGQLLQLLRGGEVDGVVERAAAGVMLAGALIAAVPAVVFRAELRRAELIDGVVQGVLGFRGIGEQV